MGKGKLFLGPFLSSQSAEELSLRTWGLASSGGAVSKYKDSTKEESISAGDVLKIHHLREKHKFSPKEDFAAANLRDGGRNLRYLSIVG